MASSVTQVTHNTDSYGVSAECNTTCSGVPPNCGDGIVNGPETCDEGALNSDTWSLLSGATLIIGKAPYC